MWPRPTSACSFVPKTDGDLLLGWDMSRYTNNFYGGQMDEMSLYSPRVVARGNQRHLPRVGVHHEPAVGKFDPTVTPAVGLAEALVAFGAEQQCHLWREQSMVGEQLYVHGHLQFDAADNLRD